MPTCQLTFRRNVLIAIAWLVLGFEMIGAGNLVGGNVSFGQVENTRKVPPDSFRHPAIIEFKGDIDWKLSKYFRTRLERARRSGVDLLILEIDSPGGLKTESLDIAETLRDVDWAYTVAWVPRQALSGAALVSLGCDEILVGPNARIGDIGVIQFDPELFAFRFAPAKVQSVLIRQARDLAESKGRPPEIAEAMINKDMLVFRRARPGGFEYKAVHVDSDDIPGPPWELIEESGHEKFLTVNGPRAVELGLADAIVADRAELAQRFGVDPSDFAVYRYTTTDALVYYLNHPLVTGLLIIIGLVALYFELSAPGIGVGGLIATLCAALFFGSRFLGGTADLFELLLFVTGLFFLIMEIFVIPGWGLPGIIGLLMVVASVFLASQNFVIPNSARQWNQFLTLVMVLVVASITFIVAAVYITRRIGKIPILNQLVLIPDSDEPDPSGKGDAKKPGPVAHPYVSVGDWGKAETLLRPAGRAIFAGRSFDVVSDGAFVEPGRQVKVIDIQGNRILVAPVEDDQDA